MPERKTVEKARRARRQGKAPTTQAGAFVEEEIHHVRQGKHGARSTKQAIAIGLSKARRSGVRLPPPKRGRAAPGTRKQAARDQARGASGGGGQPSRKRSQASTRALKRQGKQAASRKALSRHARQTAVGRRTAGRAGQGAGGRSSTRSAAGGNKRRATTARR